MLSGSSPNPSRATGSSSRASCKSYYSVADTTADALTSYVYALSAAIACEQQSLAATRGDTAAPARPRASCGGPVDRRAT